MRRIASVVILAAALLAPHALAVSGTPIEDPEVGRPVLRTIASDESNMRFVLELPEVSAEDIAVGARTFQAVEIPGCGMVGEAGEPAIPVFSRLLAVPEGATVRVRTSRLEEEVHSGVTLYPAQAASESAEGEFAFDEAAYAAQVSDDGVDVIVGEPAVFRDLRVVNLQFRPFHYDPATRTLKITRRLEVEVAIEGALPQKAAMTQKPIPPSYDAIYEAMVLNYQTLFSERDVAPGKILVIAPNSQAVLDSIQDWVDWRTRKGWPVQVVTTATAGTSNSQIKTYIQGIYDDPNTSLEYVVLVGDVAQIPTWYEGLSGYNGEGDLPYTNLAGTDWLPDVHLGRLSYGTMKQLHLIIRKIVNYESNPYMTDLTWFTRGFAVGDPSTSGPSCVETGRWLKHHALQNGYTEVDTAFTSPFVSKIQTALNRGDTFFGYRGYYGMSSWSNALTDVLSNGWKLPFVVIITCDTGSFAAGTSRTEQFLRAGTITDTLTMAVTMRGGIGAIGMATIGTHTRYNNALYYGVWQGFWREGANTMGAALDRGKLEMYLNYSAVQASTAQWFSHWMNLMGDPALDVWTAVPATLAVSYPATVPIGANSIVVTVTQSGVPIEGALVCVWKGSETYNSDYTDAEGVVELPLSNTTAGSMLLTVSKHNKKAHLGTVTVASLAYVGVIAKSIDDDASGGSSGNGNAITNPLETIEMPVQLKNFGTSAVSSVVCTLSTDDPFVTVTDAVEDIASIAAGGTAWTAEDFDFQVSPGCPDGHTVRFALEAWSGASHWHSIIEVDVTTAEFSYVRPTFYNDGGNGPDPGETVDMAVTIQNDGAGGATGITGTLISLSPQVTVVDGAGSFGTINPGSTGSNSGDRFTFSTASGTYDGYLANFLLVTTFNGGVLDTVPFGLTVGTRATSDPCGPDAYGYMAFENTDTGYPDAPTYSWVEIDPAYGGSGATEVVLGDNGDSQDKSKVVTMPFTFTYYGKSYTQATVCSNGWLSMGPSVSVKYRNWTIPGAGGPDAMLAVFWDDLYQDSGAKVYQKYDSANHRWIIEWSHMLNLYNNSIETFEAILYDPEYHPTDTGDGLILFQYNTIANVDPTDGYATVGIENENQSDGILITYFNRYPAGGTTIANGRAIKFVPTEEVATGTLQGTLYNASNGNSPVQGVQVQVIGTGRSFPSGSGGEYSGAVPPGTYTVIATHASFEPDTALGIVIVQGQPTTRDFYLTDIAGPAIVTTQHAATSDTIGPYSIPVTITDYSGLAEKTLYYQTNGSETPVAAVLAQVSGDNYVALIPGQPYPTVVQYYVYARDGGGRESYDPAGAPDLPYQFNVAPITAVLDDDYEADHGWTVNAGGDDNATSGIWLRAEPVGSVYNTLTVQPDSDYTASPGQLCFVTGNAAVGAEAGTNDVDGGKTTLFSPVFDLTGFDAASVSYSVWYTNDRGSSPSLDTWLVQVADDGSTWTDLENTMASTNAWVARNFDLDAVIDMTANVRFRFVAADEGSGSLVEAAVDEFLLTATFDIATGVEGDAPRVVETGLEPCRPNPFNPETSILFKMAGAGRAELRIYDLSGRLVKTLVDGESEAGAHEVRWNGESDAGRSVSSGVYFVRFEAPGFLQVRQITLLR